MKRTYISPVLQVVETTVSQMIAVSVKVGGTVNNSEDIGFVKGENTSGENGGFWDSETEW